MLKSLPILPLILGFCPLPYASAHYLWMTIDDQAGVSGTARIGFEEAPSAGDVHYLEHFAGKSAKGRVRFTPAPAGRYTLRTSVEEATPGREGDDDYSLIRHNCTLIMELPLEK